jgi:hypothetical protein
MHAPAAALLDLWECASHCGPHERALHLLAWALPDAEFDTLADLDLGLRDWHLLRLRRALFGPILSGYADCPHCGERLEIELDADALQTETPPPAPSPFVASDGRRFRLPSSRDLIAVSGLEEVEQTARALFARCRIDAAEAVAEAIEEDVARGLAALCAERTTQLDFHCAACGGHWQGDFEPGLFLWEEIQARAMGLIEDVHRLAEAYGWSERDILVLSDTRRAAYLSWVG